MTQEPFFDFVPTPDPNEFAFWVRIDVNAFEPKLMPQAGVTTFKDLKLPTQGTSMRSGYGDYLYTEASAAGTQGFMRFFFAKPKDAAARQVPFNTIPTEQDAQWFNVLLEEPLFVKDTNFLIASPFENNGTSLVPRWYARRKWLPGGTYRCKHKIEQFLSPVPFTADEMAGTPEPIPTEINIELPGLEFTTPKCLHPEVKAPELNTGLVVATEDGLSQPREGVRLEGQVFPATNVRRWTERVLNEQQKIDGGLYFRERVTIYPPENVRVQRY